MVDAVVSFVEQRLGGLLIDQVNFLQGVRDEVNNLRTKLEYMLCFLKDAEEKQGQDSRIRKWVSAIRDAAYEAEDIIDKFILKVEEGGIPKRTGFIACLRKRFRIDKLANMYGIGKEIQEWNKRLDEIYRNREIFGIRNIDAAGQGSSSMNERIRQIRRTTPYEDDQHVVGFTKDVELLMSELLEETPHQRVISIVGMGGLGKTTLARKLYNSSSVGDKFERKGWVFVSKDYNIQNLLRKTIKSFKRPTSKDELEKLEKMETEDLECHLHELLKESPYLVVIDDVWDTDAWASLRRALPDNKKGSRVIITTRIKLVAESSGRRKYVHKLPFLQPEESWELFCKIVFRDYDGVDDKTNRCPPSLEELARDMVRKCRDLPLNIVVLGGLLSRKHPDEWPKLGSFWRHVSSSDFESHASAHVTQILALNFTDLPHYLKLCFLYLGLFPEDFEIDAVRLIRLWVAEGFIQETEGETLEETATEYLNELIDRNLIEVAQRNWMRIRRCRVHDLLREFAIEKSKELNFLHIYDGNVYSAPSPCKYRRLASHSCGLKRFASFDQSSNLHLRTLLFFNSKNESAEIGELQFLYKKLRLLRVLDLEKIIFNHSQETEHVRLLDAIQKLIHLRYLRISRSKINKIPPSIGNLQTLQTLEFSGFDRAIITLPDEICNAKQLRHLIGRFKWPFRVKNLTNLQTLNCIVVDDQMEFNALRDLINLRELYIVVFMGESKGFTLDSIGRLRSLQTLYLCASTDTAWNPILQPLSHCQHLLQMKLDGRIGKLPTEMHEFLPNLKYLSLDGSVMKEDPTPSLEKLPKLTILELLYYRVNKFVCTARGFPQLEILFLFKCDVKEFQVGEGGMPLLRGLYNNDDVSIPERLRSIPVPQNWDLADIDEWPY